MLAEKSFIFASLWNVLLILTWDAIILFFCKFLNEKTFNFNKYIYKIKKWENNGKWYSEKLKIKKWKDYLPQYISKGGFSKRNLDALSIDYIDRFILETCRGEWTHRKCMWIAIPIILINRFMVSLIFVIVVFLINVPYICIQRYNRVRLIKIRKKVLDLSEKENNKIFNFIRKFNAVDSGRILS